LTDTDDQECDSWEDVHHGGLERSKPRARRSFTPEFKAEIVELCQRGDRLIGQVARGFDLTEGFGLGQPRTPLGAPAVRNERPDRPAGHGKAD
jgi:hypothetical protein